VYQEGESPLSGFRAPVWSADGRNVYLLSDFSRTASGLCRFDLASGRATFVAPAKQFAMLKAGQWRGFPVASLATGETWPFFVVSPEGERLMRVGEPDETIEAVVARVERQ
jgi:hypothetical protein